MVSGSWGLVAGYAGGMRHSTAALVLASLAMLAGCSQKMQQAMSPPDILHVVLVKLNDQSEARALQGDTFRMVGGATSGRSMVLGTALDPDRNGVDSDYDTAFTFRFRTREDYDAYLCSEEHQWLLNKWKPRIKSIRVFDIRGVDLLKSPERW